MSSAVIPLINKASSPDSLADIKPLAAEGYFQAIAYWLNYYLVPQKLYAQVLEDNRPGRLKILIEFERPPKPEKLLRFVGDRLYKLESNIIQGAYLIARPVGTAATTWEKSIRIPTATERQPERQPKPLITHHSSLITHHSLPTQLLHESPPVQTARRIVRNQFKFFRAALITGTAAVALAFGGLTELVVAGKLTPADSSPNSAEVPWYAKDIEDSFIASSSASSSTISAVATPSAETEAVAVSFRPASRFQGKTVEAALETIAVVPHDEVVNPADPTITLLFGGEVGLDDFIFEDASSIDNLFSEVELYQQADISMVGLAEPLASASTSLQEDFYHRTRPQAVKMLKAGGIDIVSLASEGTMTYGSRGLDETLNTLDRQGIYRVGAGRNQLEAHRPEILEVKGQRIAYLGYSPDALKGAELEKAGVAIANSEERRHIIEDIRAIRSQVDWIVVNYRWGEALDAIEQTNAEADKKAKIENNTASSQTTTSQPADWQRSLAYEAVDAGADLVVGYHPSHIQGAEIYRDRAIAYSLGDFVFDQAPLQDSDTAALRVSLRNQQMKVEFLPITIRDSKLQMAEGDRALSILKAIRNASADFEQPMRFPTVLKAKPNLKLPDALRSQPSDSDYPSAPTPDAPKPSVPVSDEGITYEPPLESQLESLPATHPIMRESEALFAPATETDTEALELEDNSELENTSAPEAVEHRGVEHRGVEHRGTEPIGVEPIDIESTNAESTVEPENTVSYPQLQGGEIIDRQSLDPNETTEPFVDPFLDPSYDSPIEPPSTESAAEPAVESAPYQLDNQQPTHPLEIPSTGGIEPYEEPLVGPISALPTTLTAAAESSNPNVLATAPSRPIPKVLND